MSAAYLLYLRHLRHGTQGTQFGRVRPVHGTFIISACHRALTLGNTQDEPFHIPQAQAYCAGSSLPGILKLLHHLACARLSAPDGHES